MDTIPDSKIIREFRYRGHRRGGNKLVRLAVILLVLTAAFLYWGVTPPFGFSGGGKASLAFNLCAVGLFVLSLRLLFLRIYYNLWFYNGRVLITDNALVLVNLWGQTTRIEWSCIKRITVWKVMPRRVSGKHWKEIAGKYQQATGNLSNIHLGTNGKYLSDGRVDELGELIAEKALLIHQTGGKTDRLDLWNTHIVDWELSNSP